MSIHALSTGPGVAQAASRAPRLEALLQSRLLYVATGTLGLFLHLWLAMPIYSWSDRLGAWVLLVVLLIALRDFLKRGVKSLPIFLLVSAQIYLFYGVPQFSQDRMELLTGLYSPTARALSWAVWLVVLGEVLFLAGYGLVLRWMGGRNYFDRFLPVPSRSWKAAVFVYSIPSAILYGLSTLRPDAIPLAIRMATLSFFNLWLALALLLYLGYMGKDRRSLAGAWVIITGMSALGFIQGGMGAIVFPVVMGFIAAWLWARAIRVRWLVLVLMATVIINPVKNRFRSLAWEDKDVSSVEKVEFRLDSWSQAFTDVWGGAVGDSVQQNVMQTASRASDLLSFAQAIDYVPSQIPFNRGEGMATSFFYWIPRIFWPDKKMSSDLLYNRYAITFGYLSTAGTEKSTTGASVYTEGYWNFGWVGVLLFLTASGLLLGLLFGHNGRTGDASSLVAVAYLGANMLLLQPVTLVFPAAVTYAVGVSVALWGIARAADFANPSATRRWRHP